MLVKSYYNCFLLVTKLSLFLDNNWTTTISVEEKVLQLSQVKRTPKDYINELSGRDIFINLYEQVHGTRETESPALP